MDGYAAGSGDLSAYLDALSAWDAGAIELMSGEDPSTVQLMACRAATLLELRLLTGWDVEGGRTLYWLVLGRSEGTPARRPRC
jgi:hypothetical protein